MQPRLTAFVLATALLALTAAPAHADDAAARQITDADDLLPGYVAHGQLGDFLLTNGDIAVIIEDVGNVHGDGLSGGNIVDAGVAPYWEDELASHLTVLMDHPRQAVYDTVFVESDGSGGTAVIVAGGVDSENSDLAVTTRYGLSPDDRFIEVETTVSNEGASISGYSAGDALDWGNALHFAPGYGFDLTGLTTYSSWFGSSGAGACYGYALATGIVTARHGDLWTDTTVFTGSIPAGGSATFTRYFIVGALGLASVSDVAHEIQGAYTGTLAGTITDQDTGLPIPGVTVTCDVGGTSTYTRARSDSLGNYSATLFQGSYTLRASVASYLSDEQAASIATSQTTNVSFALEPGHWAPEEADTLTVVTRPILSIPTMVTPGDALTIEAEAPSSTAGWAASLKLGGIEIPLTITNAEYRTTYLRWFLTATVPTGTAPELYDLVVSASGDIYDEVVHSVAVKSEDPSDFYFIHITDTHMPTHKYYYEEGAESDSTELDDMRAVIEDINLINPAFVLFTGDVVNEGELEEYLNWRAYTKSKRILRELEVPVYVVAGNHDIGGWNSTPPPGGTARRAWWRFFGWNRLYDPPPAEPIYTQNYSFDYGGAHFIGMEAYNNYDNWRYWFYGRDSFTNRQMNWMVDDISTVDPATPIIAFYHCDFWDEMLLDYYGIDCALYGHIHRDRGSLTEFPLNIATNNVCDGERSMRLVRVSDGAIAPTPTIRAGSSGERLRVSFDRPNNGTESTITATVINTHEMDFEHGLVKFHVRADSLPYAVEDGELIQTIVDGSTATCYVGVNMAYGTTTVTINPTTGVADSALVLLRQNQPNPARTGTTVSFVLASPTEVALDVFDVAGRKVATIADGPHDAGPQETAWDLTDSEGNAVSSGVYFYRLEAGGEKITRKMIVVR